MNCVICFIFCFYQFSSEIYLVYLMRNLQRNCSMPGTAWLTIFSWLLEKISRILCNFQLILFQVELVKGSQTLVPGYIHILWIQTPEWHQHFLILQYISEIHRFETGLHLIKLICWFRGHSLITLAHKGTLWSGNLSKMVT